MLVGGKAVLMSNQALQSTRLFSRNVLTNTDGPDYAAAFRMPRFRASAWKWETARSWPLGHPGTVNGRLVSAAPLPVDLGVGRIRG